MISDKITYSIIFVCLLCIFLVFVKAYEDTKLSPNEQTLNQYATFESTCSYRGYNRDECLLIWSGR